MFKFEGRPLLKQMNFFIQVLTKPSRYKENIYTHKRTDSGIQCDFLVYSEGRLQMLEAKKRCSLNRYYFPLRDESYIKTFGKNRGCNIPYLAQTKSINLHNGHETTEFFSPKLLLMVGAACNLRSVMW